MDERTRASSRRTPRASLIVKDILATSLGVHVARIYTRMPCESHLKRGVLGWGGVGGWGGVYLMYDENNILHFYSIFLHKGNKGSNIFLDPTGTKACVMAAHLMASDGNMYCFMVPFSSCDIKISVVSQCRILMALQYMNTQLFAFTFSTDNLHLLNCPVTWSLWTLTEADWSCWLAADALAQTHKFETESDSGLTINRLHTAYKRTLLAAAADASSMAEQLCLGFGAYLRV